MKWGYHGDIDGIIFIFVDQNFGFWDLIIACCVVFC